MSDENNTGVVICPLTKKELPDTCLTCTFCIKENGERTGCYIRKQVRMFFNYKDDVKKCGEVINEFKDKIINGN